jgi:hypothetical protein
LPVAAFTSYIFGVSFLIWYMWRNS